MLPRIRRRASYANVMSTIAVFFALATGGAYAANTIGSGDVIDNSLLSTDLRDGTIKAADIGSGQVPGSRVSDSTITTVDIQNGAVRIADIGLSQVNGTHIADGSVKGAEVDESSLGNVPSASSAASAQTAGHASVAGKAAVQDYQVIFRHAPFDNLVRKERSFEVDCPAGKRPISGGGNARTTAIDYSTGQPPDGSEVTIAESRPSGGYVYGEDDNRPTGWKVRAEASDRATYNAGINLTVWVVCAKTDL